MFKPKNKTIANNRNQRIRKKENEELKLMRANANVIKELKKEGINVIQVSNNLISIMSTIKRNKNSTKRVLQKKSTPKRSLSNLFKPTSQRKAVKKRERIVL